MESRAGEGAAAVLRTDEIGLAGRREGLSIWSSLEPERRNLSRSRKDAGKAGGRTGARTCGASYKWAI